MNSQEHCTKCGRVIKHAKQDPVTKICYNRCYTCMRSDLIRPPKRVCVVEGCNNHPRGNRSYCHNHVLATVGKKRETTKAWKATQNSWQDLERMFEEESSDG